MVPVILKKYSKFVGTDLSVPCALLCTKHEQVRAYNSRFSTGNSVIRRISLWNKACLV